jgi:predicted permease
MSMIMRDFRYAARSLRKQPTFSLTVLAMLTLGIAGNTTIFSVFNALFLRPLPFIESDRLVDLDTTAPQWNLDFTAVNFQEFTNWRDHNETFDDMAVYRRATLNVSGEGEPERLTGAQVSHSMANVLRINPILGRHFTPEEDVAEGPKVVQLGQAMWRDRYGSNPDILNRTLTLDGESYTIIGVLPPAATFLAESNYWVPLQADVAERRGSWWLTSVGRLSAGVTLNQARRDLVRIHENAAAADLASSNTSPVINPILERTLGEYRLGTSAMLGAVGVVLLLACANITGLTLARSMARRQEIAIRLALGAGRWRIARQFLAESVVLASVGAMAGMLIGRLGATALRSMTDDALPAWMSFTFDSRVIGFVVLIAASAALAIGVLPALSASRAGVSESATGASLRTTETRGKRFGLNALVASEIALAAVLLVAAGLSVSDFRALLQTDPGFEPENLLAYRVALPASRYDGDERVAFFDTHLERVRGLPGVEVAGAATNPPLTFHNGYFFDVEGEPPRDSDTPMPVTLVRNITPGYLEAIGATILAGRSFTPQDFTTTDNQVVIVNETFARRYWPEGEALGKRIRAGSESDWITVVGVNRDVKHYGLDAEMRQGVYLSHVPMQPFSMAILIRTDTDPLTMVGPARAVLREMDGNLAMSDITTMTQALSDSLWARRAASWLAGVFATVALLLAVGGIYGVISYSVSHHTREIGIRMALGARPRQELNRILRQGGAVIAIGLTAGLLGAVAVGRLLSSVLVDVSPIDTTVFLTVATVVVVVTVTANFLPARRAAAIHPAEILRGE